MTSPERRVLLGVSTAVLFPQDVATIDIERRENLRALEELPGQDPLCVVVPVSEPGANELTPERLFRGGTLARILARTGLPEGGQRIVVQGIRRVLLRAVRAVDGFLSADVVPAPQETSAPASELERHLQAFLTTLGELRARDPGFCGELAKTIPLYGADPARVSDLAAAVLPLPYEDRARLLIEPDPLRRVLKLHRALEREVERKRRETPPPSEKPHVEEEQRSEPTVDVLEIERIERQIAETKLPDLARKVLLSELEHLRLTPAYAPEGPTLRRYLEWSLELPWASRPRSGEKGRLERVAETLSQTHVGLEDVKERVAEFLAVRQLGGGARGTVMCFLGPPGTGKSSMGRAVAEAMSRRFLTIPLGAITHEREIVGVSHRRHGATPGAILAGLHRSGAPDPVILLDEVDKVSLGGEGNAAGALLHLLDPEQNGEFLDHYLGVPFDLSRCLFIATANDADEIPEALLDRMEIVEFNGYTESEKYTIARRHLVPRARAHAGVDSKRLKISPGALRAVIRGYTEEAGVRQLHRVLMSLARKAAVRVVRGEEGLSVRKSDLVKLLGPREVDEEPRLARPTVGVATGLAWTAVGGALLPIEALAMGGSGHMILTGQIGDVMRESVQTAVSYVRTRLEDLGLKRDVLEELDLHLHFPSAATPKDGPSGGIAVVSALVSLLTQLPARHDIAMTGEMSLLGGILPVGGIREKLLAAIRGGIPEVILPARNAEEILRLSPEIKSQITIHLVEDVEQALDLVLLERPGNARESSPPKSSMRRVAKQAKDRDAS